MGQEVEGRETDAIFRMCFFFLKVAGMKKKDLGWTYAASWKRAWSLLPTARGSSEDALELEAHSVNSTPYRTHIAHAYFLARGSRLSSRLSGTSCSLKHVCLSISRTMSHLHSSWLDLPPFPQCHREKNGAERGGVVRWSSGTQEAVARNARDSAERGAAIACLGSWCSRHACVVMFSAADSWIGWCHVGAEPLSDEGIPCQMCGNPTRKLGSQVSNVTHRSGASVTSIDAFLNPDGGDTPWLLLLDLASTHRDARANTRAHQIRFHCGWRNQLCTTTRPCDLWNLETCCLKPGQSSTGCLAVGHGWTVELLRGPWCT